MRRLLLVAIPTAFVIAALLWIGKGSSQSNMRIAETAVVKVADRSASVSPAASVSAMQIQNETGRSDRDDVEGVRRVIEAANVAIAFWGRISDENGDPIPNVNVAYTYSIDHGNERGSAWIDEEERDGVVTSDLAGIFVIQGLTGHYLTLESFAKPNYIYRKRFSLTYNFYGDAPSGRFVSRPERPVHFAMIRTTATEPLVQVKGRVEVRGDGTAERWNLWSGEADPNGELAVVFRADPGVSANPAQILNWSADLEVVGGGITEAPWEEDVRRAPESGYSRSVAYPKVDQKQGVPHRSFYLRTADGKYGRIQVELSTSHDGRTARCLIRGDMNPRPGSRNLESVEGD